MSVDLIAKDIAFLNVQLPWLRHATRPDAEPYAVQVFAEIADCARRMRSLVDGPREQKYLGPCGANIETDVTTIDPDHGEGIRTYVLVECEGDVYGVAGATGRCRTCGATVDQQARRAWLDDEVRARAYRATQIEEAYGIKAKTILSWRDRGQLLPHGTDGHDHRGMPRPTFNVGDVLDLAATTAARREKRRVERARRKPAEMGA